MLHIFSEIIWIATVQQLMSWSLLCRFDILVGRSPRMGNATRVSFQSHISLVEDLKPGKCAWWKTSIEVSSVQLSFGFTVLIIVRYAVTSCGWLSPPINGKKAGTTYLQGATVRLSCDDGYTLSGSAERVCQQSGLWSGEETSCVVPSMNKLWNQSCPMIFIFTNHVCECVFVAIQWSTKISSEVLRCTKNEITLLTFDLSSKRYCTFMNVFLSKTLD